MKKLRDRSTSLHFVRREAFYCDQQKQTTHLVMEALNGMTLSEFINQKDTEESKEQISDLISNTK